jgi:hypothetical protein
MRGFDLIDEIHGHAKAADLPDHGLQHRAT